MILLLAFGLSMDAFAVSMTNGMCYRIPVWRNALSSGLAFGLAQGLMPLLGYLLGMSFSDFVQRVDHWMAFLLLGFIGARMLHQANKERKCPETNHPRSFSYKTLFVQAVATSIDALAIGVGLGALKTNLYLTVGTIAAITFLCCVIGVFMGRKFGQLFKDKAEFLGGAILILIGVKIFVEHMGWLG